MKRWIFVALVLMGFAELGQGQSNGKPSPTTVTTEDAAAKYSANTYFVLGATPKQEALLRAQIEAMRPDLLPLRIIFVPHWKYLVTTKAFQLQKFALESSGGAWRSGGHELHKQPPRHHPSCRCVRRA